MNGDKILSVNKEHLLLMQVVVWFAPGVVITRKGIMAMLCVGELHPERLWWLAVIAIAVVVSFSLMFNSFIKRYTARILNFPTRKKSLLAFLDLHGYVLITFMMCLGIGLKYIPGMPVDFFAGFYPGLGAALVIAGMRYFVSWCQAVGSTNMFDLS